MFIVKKKNIDILTGIKKRLQYLFIMFIEMKILFIIMNALFIMLWGKYIIHTCHKLWTEICEIRQNF